MNWETTWKNRVKTEIVLDDGVLSGSECSWAWEEVYQAFKRRLEEEKTLEPECEHASIGGTSYKIEYKYKYCPKCGEKL